MKRGRLGGGLSRAEKQDGTSEPGNQSVIEWHEGHYYALSVIVEERPRETDKPRQPDWQLTKEEVK